MNEKNIFMLKALEELERHLQQLDWWQHEAPSPEALASTAPFCIDTLTFSQWLQWVFVPKTRAIIAQNGDLPTKSALLPLAQEAWKHHVDRDAIEALEKVIANIDDVLNGVQSA